MPYIPKNRREQLDIYDNFYGQSSPETAGELNYLFTFIIQNYIEYKGLNYQIINDIIGALEGAKLEFYRRKAALYEDLKCQQNGDVY